MRITQIITILLSGALLVLAGWLAVSPPQPHLAVQADFVEAAAPAAPVTPEPTTPAPTAPAAPVVSTGPAAFKVEGLDYNPGDEPEPLADIKIVFKVTNTGGQQGTYKAVLKVTPVTADPGQGVFTKTEDVTLASGETKLISIDYKTGTVGLYKITLDELTKNLNVAVF